MKTELQVLKSGDIEKLNELISVFENVFEMRGLKKPGTAHLQNILNKKTFFAVVATIEEKVIAGLTVHVLDQYYSERPLAYIYDLAVLPEYQRKGIGKRLIDFTNAYCRQNGVEEVFVQVHKADDHAIDFYRSTKPTNEEQVFHFHYILQNDNGAY
ncbi:MAG: GNAT family N-acetyltransferase [Bacteroidetes bacterium]|nr:GNAT family N-acetyltransferase [Bacteroidota bacterium]